MTGTQFAAYIRNLTRTNSSTFPDSEIVILANVVKDEFAPKIMEANEDLFGVPATRNLVASDDTDITKREYSLPDDLIAMKSVEAMLDGETWIRLSEFDLTKFKRPTNEESILSYYSNAQGGAYFDIFRKALWLYTGTVTATDDGLKLFYIAYPADIAAGDLAGSADLSIDPTSTSSSIPRQFHELWARRVSILWKSNKEKPIPLTERELSFKVDFEETIENLRNFNRDRDITAFLPDDTRLQS